ncbi:MAG: hydroxymethylglutaryl-CoA lyase [Bdellovibrionales bacterium]|nr:hydroxymethylglutaryl-CoA lyase [Bdellovibrionales bacterium]
MAKRFPPRQIEVFEVGVRDGLQNEARAVRFEDKIRLAQGLIDAGVRRLELGAFVRPDLVPQMADTERVYGAVREGALKLGRAKAYALVPNRKGLDRAIAAGAKGIAVFTAATESFARKNIGMSIDESLAVFAEVVAEAKRKRIEVRGYVSTAFGCPFEGKVAPKKAIAVVERLAKLGIPEISVGDTIGVATPKGVVDVMAPLVTRFERKSGKKTRIAGHFHDTRGTALANALAAMEVGVTILDSSAGGLGGCPFAPGATGNLATEDLVYLLDGMGIRSGIDLEKLSATSLAFSRLLGRPLSSRYLQAYASACEARNEPRGALR